MVEMTSRSRKTPSSVTVWYLAASAWVSGRLEFSMADSYESKNTTRQVAVGVVSVPSQDLAAGCALTRGHLQPLLVDGLDGVDVVGLELDYLNGFHSGAASLGYFPVGELSRPTLGLPQSSLRTILTESPRLAGPFGWIV